MGEKKREDFVWVRPANGSGEVTLVQGRLAFHASQEKPLEVTRGEWKSILEPSGAFELVEKTAAAKPGDPSTRLDGSLRVKSGTAGFQED